MKILLMILQCAGKYCKLKCEIEWEGGVAKGKARRESVSHSQLEFLFRIGEGFRNLNNGIRPFAVSPSVFEPTFVNIF